jgi:hypothetical protein
MTDTWPTEERARCVSEVAALEQGGRIIFDNGSAEQDVTDQYRGRLEKWIEFLDIFLENQRKQRPPDQDHVDEGDRGATGNR